jgi:catechol 2,3-dioxygenase-like lactoylglutathione lyase family enzyme
MFAFRHLSDGSWHGLVIWTYSPVCRWSSTGNFYCVSLDLSTLEGPVRVIDVIADIQVPDVTSARGFYADYLGLCDEEFNLGWAARYTCPETGAHIQLLTRDASARENPVASIKVDDVEAALEEATARGYEIVHPLTTEPWGVRRFFVRAPDGNVFNIVAHVE